MTLVVVTGMPGAGSSTVVKEGLKRCGERCGEGERERAGGFTPLNYGDVMFEAAKEEGLVESRDEMRRLPGEKQREIQLLACHKIAELERGGKRKGGGKSKNIIIDTHCTVKTRFGYLPGLPERVLRVLKPDLFVLVEAEPAEISRRRQTDKTRQRDVEAEKSIEEHQFMNRAVSMAYACLTSASVKIIENHQDELERAAEEFSALLKALSES